MNDKFLFQAGHHIQPADLGVRDEYANLALVMDKPLVEGCKYQLGVGESLVRVFDKVQAESVRIIVDTNLMITSSRWNNPIPMSVEGAWGTEPQPRPCHESDCFSDHEAEYGCEINSGGLEDLIIYADPFEGIHSIWWDSLSRAKEYERRVRDGVENVGSQRTYSFCDTIDYITEKWDTRLHLLSQRKALDTGTDISFQKVLSGQFRKRPQWNGRWRNPMSRKDKKPTFLDTIFQDALAKCESKVEEDLLRKLWQARKNLERADLSKSERETQKKAYDWALGEWLRELGRPKKKTKRKRR